MLTLCSCGTATPPAAFAENHLFEELIGCLEFFLLIEIVNSCHVWKKWQLVSSLLPFSQLLLCFICSFAIVILASNDHYKQANFWVFVSFLNVFWWFCRHGKQNVTAKVNVVSTYLVGVTENIEDLYLSHSGNFAIFYYILAFNEGKITFSKITQLLKTTMHFILNILREM